MATKASNKTHVKFACTSCGNETARWLGRCPACQDWNTLVEVVERPLPSTNTALRPGGGGHPMLLHDIGAEQEVRTLTGMAEFDRVLGGGIVAGSIVLIGGDPGIGKSTLLLQAAALIANQGREVLYVSGEESLPQIKLRAKRLGLGSAPIAISAETDIERITELALSRKPGLLIVDSIQTMSQADLGAPAGNVTQLRECTVRLMSLAKSSGIPVFIVGHVTKEGTIAGPRALEHIVDTVLYLEGDRFQTFRLLRGAKNRFGSTNEVGVFDMVGDGMREVENPSEIFLAERGDMTSGCCVIVTLEGTRPILVEVQALVAKASLGVPRRTAAGLDYNRLLTLLAVLTKRIGVPLFDQDVYLNVVGGLKISEPAADLGACVAVASSFRELPLPPDMVFMGEVGLGGELRSVTQIEKRLAEAAKLGFRRAVVPRMRRLPQAIPDFTIHQAATLAEALEFALRVARQEIRSQ